ncbi:MULTISPECIES: response regulator transcription factor [unclassified Bradyrhizobium]|uniref:LuxR C-terminal-related transcriptional regulator n=2 Tax=Bradyrhizobium TaxID=374 RepID=UPI0020115BB4|nr:MULTISPECIES: response regulator transcription factor [unclassified Bradyrhizobium]
MSIADNKAIQSRAFDCAAAGRIEPSEPLRTLPQLNEIRPKASVLASPHLRQGAAAARSGPSPRSMVNQDAGRRIHAAGVAHVDAGAYGQGNARLPGALAHVRATRPPSPGPQEAADAELLAARLDELVARRRGQDEESLPPTIVVIGERVLVRDCLVQGLQLAYAHHAVLAFPTLATWLDRHGDGPLPSVVLLFMQGRRRNGNHSFDEVDMLGRISVAVPVIVVSDVEDGDRIMQALEKGVRGYIPTSMAFSVAIEAVRLVEAGGTFVPVSSLLASRRDSAANGNSMFTARQIMVVEALHRGKANKQIAYELNMRESTVKVHIRHIMKKLNARNRTEVAVMTSSLFDDHLDEADGSAT